MIKRFLGRIAIVALLAITVTACASRVAERPDTIVAGVQADFNAALGPITAFQESAKCSVTCKREILNASTAARDAIRRAQDVVRANPNASKTDAAIEAAISLARSAVERWKGTARGFGAQVSQHEPPVLLHNPARLMVLGA